MVIPQVSIRKAKNNNGWRAVQAWYWRRPGARCFKAGLTFVLGSDVDVCHACANGYRRLARWRVLSRNHMANSMMHRLRTRTGFPMHTFMTRRSDSLAVTARMRKPNSIPFLQRIGPGGIREACACARRAPDLHTLTLCLGRDGP